MESETVSLGIADPRAWLVEERVEIYDAPPGSPGPVKVVFAYRQGPDELGWAAWRRPTTEEWEFMIWEGVRGELRRVMKARDLHFAQFSAEPGVIYFREA